MFKKNKLKAIAFYLILFSGVLFFLLGKPGGSREKEVVMTLRDYLVNSFVAELAEINKNLPNKIDDNTTLLSIDYSNGRVISRYGLDGFNGDPSSIKNFGDQLKSTLKAEICSDELKSKLLSVDVEFLGKYQDPKGAVIFEINVKSSDCVGLDLSK
ncbi:MAG: hypothetical protein EBS86_17345 [Crocinitomicaceae bacterium]|nr:hypothetical protein [Crocinitomicaceae bacterium]